MDLMPVHTAQSPEFIAPVHDANARRMAARQQAAAPQEECVGRLISAMSLRNISIENYTYEMMKTQYHDLIITIFARKVSGRNFRFKKGKEKEKQKAKRAVPFGFKPYRKSGSGGKANMANENQDPYDQAYWGKGKGKKGKKGNSKFKYPYDGNKGYAARQSDCTIHKAYICRLDRPRLGPIMELW